PRSNRYHVRCVAVDLGLRNRQTTLGLARPYEQKPRFRPRLAHLRGSFQQGGNTFLPRKTRHGHDDIACFEAKLVAELRSGGRLCERPIESADVYAGAGDDQTASATNQLVMLEKSLVVAYLEYGLGGAAGCHSVQRAIHGSQSQGCRRLRGIEPAPAVDVANHVQTRKMAPRERDQKVWFRIASLSEVWPHFREERREISDRDEVGQGANKPLEREPMKIQAGPSERRRVAAARRRDSKAAFAQEKHKRNAQIVVFAPDIKDVRSHNVSLRPFGRGPPRDVAGNALSERCGHASPREARSSAPVHALVDPLFDLDGAAPRGFRQFTQQV